MWSTKTCRLPSRLSRALLPLHSANWSPQNLHLPPYRQDLGDPLIPLHHPGNILFGVILFPKLPVGPFVLLSPALTEHPPLPTMMPSPSLSAVTCVHRYSVSGLILPEHLDQVSTIALSCTQLN